MVKSSLNEHIKHCTVLSIMAWWCRLCINYDAL